MAERDDSGWITIIENGDNWEIKIDLDLDYADLIGVTELYEFWPEPPGVEYNTYSRWELTISYVANCGMAWEDI